MTCQFSNYMLTHDLYCLSVCHMSYDQPQGDWLLIRLKRQTICEFPSNMISFFKYSWYIRGVKSSFTMENTEMWNKYSPDTDPIHL